MLLNRFKISLKLDSFLFWLKYKSPAADWTQTKEVTGQAFSGIWYQNYAAESGRSIKGILKIEYFVSFA